MIQLSSTKHVNTILMFQEQNNFCCLFSGGAHPPTTYTQKTNRPLHHSNKPNQNCPSLKIGRNTKWKGYPLPFPSIFQAAKEKKTQQNQPRSLQSRNQKPGLLLAEAELNSTGLVLPHPFGTLNYETTIFRPRGTGVRRLEGEEVPTEASATWDPENHPSTSGCKIWKKGRKG